MKCESRK